MLPETLPQLSLGGAALVIFAICAAAMLVKGVARIIIGTGIIGLSAWIGFLVWQQAPALAQQITAQSNPWILYGLPLTAFVSTMLLCRKIRKSLASPFGNSQDGDQSRSVIGTAFRLCIAIIPAALIWLIGAAYIHHSGTIEEVREFSQKNDPATLAKDAGWSKNFKSAVESAIPQSWLTAINPDTEPTRVALAKLISAQAHSPLKPVIDPQTGRPYPRAIIVDDPQLQNLARTGKFDTLLKHPRLTKALNDPSLKKLLNDLSL
jgi:hypothetical protein